MSRVHQVRRAFIFDGEVRRVNETVDLGSAKEELYKEILEKGLVYTSEMAEPHVEPPEPPSAASSMYRVDGSSGALELNERELASTHPPRSAIPVDLPPTSSPRRKKE